MGARLKALTGILVWSLLGLLLYACTGESLTGPSSPEPPSEPEATIPTSAPAPSTHSQPVLGPDRVCGAETSVDLVAGRDIPVGEVTVTNDDEALSVVYRLEGGWELVETHLSVADDVGDVPTTPSGQPQPGRFHESEDHDPGTTAARYDLALDELEAVEGDRLVVAGHADVRHPGDPSDPEDDRHEGAWADGERFSERGAWATYFEVTVQGCQSVTEVVDSEGGTVTAEGASVTIPPGALDGEVAITIDPVAEEDLDELDLTDEERDALVAGAVVDLGPDGQAFDEPVEVTIGYDASRLGDGLDESDLQIAIVTDDLELLDSSVDTRANEVTASTTHFTFFGVVEPLLLPIDLVIEEAITVADESSTLGSEELAVGEVVTVSDEVLVELGPPPIDLTVTETVSVSDVVSIELGSSNTSPSATITSPADGATFTEGTSILFEGSGSDTEDGTLTGSSLVWSSDLDGQLGTGTSISAVLSLGTHTVTLNVTDSDGASGTDRVTVTVESTPDPDGSGGILVNVPPGGGVTNDQVFLVVPGESTILALTGDDPDVTDDGFFARGWSPDGRDVLFADFGENESGGGDLFRMHRDGSGKTQLTNSQFERESGATWSPAGNQIAFSLFRSVDGDEEIFVMNSDGSGVQKVTDNELRDYQPSWSPDGTRIAFTQLDALDSSINDIVVINVDGTGEASLTGGASSNSHPAWSPSGDRIAFGSDRDSDENFMRCAVYVMDVDGANVLRLTEPTQAQCSFLDEFRWSPDGSRIAVLRTPDGKATTPAEIWIVEADGSGAVNVTNNGPARDYAPVWSPDGSHIVFGSDRSGDNELYIMNADGSGVTLLANPGGVERAVEWE